MKTVKILWLWPDVLNLHGNRGDVMALSHVAKLLAAEVEIRRHDVLCEPPDLSWPDLVWLGCGELRCMPRLVSVLAEIKDQVQAYAVSGKLLVAVGATGALLAEETKRLDGSAFAGLGLLDMICREREVYGNDLWFETEGEQIVGSQIQIIDTELAETQQPFGRVIYGIGNGDSKQEGAQKQGVIFSNCLGPMLVKNPRLAARMLGQAGGFSATLTPEQTQMEDCSFSLITKFIQKKET